MKMRLTDDEEMRFSNGNSMKNVIHAKEEVEEKLGCGVYKRLLLFFDSFCFEN